MKRPNKRRVHITTRPVCLSIVYIERSVIFYASPSTVLLATIGLVEERCVGRHPVIRQSRVVVVCRVGAYKSGTTPSPGRRRCGRERWCRRMRGCRARTATRARCSSCACARTRRGRRSRSRSERICPMASPAALFFSEVHVWIPTATPRAFFLSSLTGLS